ncbi:PilW family protein [Roseateles chitinivorans]|uniref:PilW family protein n=1 Tax=Roseateles chitinivorans TaxID=2917965 RepID=UPI003D67E06F
MKLQARPLIAAGLSSARGFSLIELMVSMVIALVVIVAMATVSSRFETSKRQDSAASDMSTNSGYLAYDLDRQLRSAGSGFSVMRSETYGCQLFAIRNSNQILPALAAFPAPFATVTQDVRMMPVLAYPGVGAGGSDVLQFMTGTGGLGETATQVRLNSVQTNTLRLTTTVGIRGNDLLLISESGRPCMLEQVTATAAGGASQQLDLAGSYFATSIGTESINTRSTAATANAMVFGNATNGNPPKLMLLGVNANQQLVRYDLLQFTNDSSQNPVPVADGVVDMRVMYGVSGATVGVVDSWVTPSGSWGPTALNAGTPTAQALINRILAVKISMVLRSEHQEMPATNGDPTSAYVAPATVAMFPSLPSAQRVNYTVADRYRTRRHRVVEFTIPLRNLIAMSGRPPPP